MNIGDIATCYECKLPKYVKVRIAYFDDRIQEVIEQVYCSEECQDAYISHIHKKGK